MTDWPAKTLGEVARFDSETARPEDLSSEDVYVGLENIASDGTLAGLGNVSAETLKSNKARFTDKHILFGKLRPYLVKVVRPNFSGVCSTDILPIKPSAELSRDYLYWYLRSPAVIDAATEASTGTTLPRVSPTTLKSFNIPVPPLEEQKRIVELLDAATTRVTELTACYEQARTHANDLLESSFLELFAEAFESHPKRKMGEVLQIARGGSPRPISEFITNSSKGVNWIKIGDASSSTKYIYETAQKIKPEGVSRSRMVYPGDFLLSNSMSFGRPYIMKTEGCIHDGWLVLRDSKGDLDQDFLFYLLSSRFMYERFSQLAAGSTVQNLNSALVSSVEIPVPPLNVQRKIAEKARVLEENVARLNEVSELRLQLAKELRQSILESAFAGDL